MACAAGSDASAGRILSPGTMNSKHETAAIELLLIAGLALLWAAITLARALLVPLAAALLVLLTPRRRTAPQPAAAASDEAPAPIAATAEAAPTLAGLAESLLELPATQLRDMAGTRRRLPKRELTALICAMPI